MAQERIDTISKTIQVISVVLGVIISVISFNHAQEVEAENRRIEAAKPFLELRQRFYLKALEQAAILSNPETHSKNELEAAKKSFRELYVAELSMVEAKSVERDMVKFAKQVDTNLIEMTSAQSAAYELSHALRNSLVNSWNVDQQIVDNSK
ncbi:MAG: hypothetical protein WCE54_01110 [Ignavibacteriaceae bacterium]